MSKEKTKLEGKNGLLEPKKVNCFQCGKDFFIKFVIPKQKYSQKNNWGYWTGIKENEQKYICDVDLRKFYYNKPLYWETVKNLKKRQQFRTYIYHGVISASA